MAQLPIRALAKLKITATTGSKEKFIAPYNPATLDIQSGTETAPKVNINDPDPKIETLYALNRRVSVDLFLDGTGTSLPFGAPLGELFGAAGNLLKTSGASQVGLAAQVAAQSAFSIFGVDALIDKFYKVTTTFADGIHTSNELKLKWGKGLSMDCKLVNSSVKYSMFNQFGKALRATISATFISSGSDSQRKKFLSPDLTKVHLVKAGDTLYNIAKAEYDDESYYLQIAQTNNLKNYRKLIPGQQLILPPIAKV